MIINLINLYKPFKMRPLILLSLFNAPKKACGTTTSGGTESTSTNGKDKTEKERSKWDDYQEAVRDLRVNWLAKLGKPYVHCKLHS